MELSNEIKREATRYLLGAATVEEQTALEEKYFSDPGFFAQVVAVEKELLDDYARDRLPSRERELMERHYLAHPKRRARGMTAQALVSKLDRAKPLIAEPRTISWWRELFAGFQSRSLAFGMALAVLFLGLGSARLLFETKRLRSQLDQSQVARAGIEKRQRELQELLAQQQGRNDQLSAELEQLRAAQPQSTAPFAPSFVSLLMTAGLVRDGNQAETPRLVIPAGVEQVRLQLKIKESLYPRYRLSLETAGGQTIRTLQNLKPDRANTFTVRLASNLFTTGEYVLALSGVNDNGESDSLSKTLFRIESKTRGIK